MTRWIVTLLGEHKYGGHSRIFAEKYHAVGFYEDRTGQGYQAVLTEVSINFAEVLKDSAKEEQRYNAAMEEAERRQKEGVYAKAVPPSALSIDDTKKIFASLLGGKDVNHKR